MNNHYLIALLFSLSACATVPDRIIGNGVIFEGSQPAGWVQFCKEHPSDKDCAHE